MSAEVIEGSAVEVIPPERALVPAQPGQALVAAETPTGPAEMIAKATALADALSAMVSKQKLYTEIRGKKYPHVEAWQTIGRMDNVVARESQPPIRHEDGSYEAFVELIRLSDGMVIGGASALCGTKDDVAGRQDWSKASEPSRRSMAATRATSRAFRGQYAWIMALAGYQPTPADEMPDEPNESPRPTGPSEAFLGMLSKAGTIKKGDAAGYKLELRQTPDGPTFGFRFEFDGKDEAGAQKAIPQVLVPPDIATPLILDIGGDPAVLVKKHATLRGALFGISQPGRDTYYRLVVKEWRDDERTIPAPIDPTINGESIDGASIEAPSVPLFTEDDMAALDAEAGAA